jgi:hypothetical protein
MKPVHSAGISRVVAQQDKELLGGGQKLAVQPKAVRWFRSVSCSLRPSIALFLVLRRYSFMFSPIFEEIKLLVVRRCVSFARIHERH